MAKSRNKITDTYFVVVWPHGMVGPLDKAGVSNYIQDRVQNGTDVENITVICGKKIDFKVKITTTLTKK